MGGKWVVVGMGGEIGERMVNVGIDLWEVIRKNRVEKGIERAVEMRNGKMV